MRLKYILDVLEESNKYNPDKTISILRGAGFKTFSKPQEMNAEGLDLFTKYIEDKVDRVSTLYDKENSIRIFELEVGGNITKTLIKDILDILNRKI